MENDFYDVAQFIKLNFGVDSVIKDTPVRHLQFRANGKVYTITTEKCHGGRKVWLVTHNNLPILCEDSFALSNLIIDIFERSEE